jgi:hypothetical protein
MILSLVVPALKGLTTLPKVTTRSFEKMIVHQVSPTLHYAPILNLKYVVSFKYSIYSKLLVDKITKGQVITRNLKDAKMVEFGWYITEGKLPACWYNFHR